MARALGPRSRWLSWGGFAGALYGAGYAWLGCRVVGEGDEPAVLATSAALGAVVGVVFAARYRAAGPAETNLCTWLGMLVGAVPTLGLVVLELGPTSRVGVYLAAAIAFLPIVVGMLVGGALDRLSERFLFVDGPAAAPGP